MPQWRIYYTNGSTYSDEDGPWHDAPGLDVQVIVVPEPSVGRVLRARYDYFWWDAKRESWFGGDINGRITNDLQPGPTRTLYGRMVWNHEYQECVKRALADPDFPAKSARHPEEIF